MKFSITNSTFESCFLLSCFSWFSALSRALSVGSRIVSVISSRSHWKQNKIAGAIVRTALLKRQNQMISYITITKQWKIKIITHYLKLTVNKAIAKTRLLKINTCVEKSRSLFFTLKSVTSGPTSSATVDAQAMLRKDTGRETIWMIDTDCCWTAMAYNWIINWGADSRTASARTASLLNFSSWFISFSGFSFVRLSGDSILLSRQTFGNFFFR